MLAGSQVAGGACCVAAYRVPMVYRGRPLVVVMLHDGSSVLLS